MNNIHVPYSPSAHMAILWQTIYVASKNDSGFVSGIFDSSFKKASQKPCKFWRCGRAREAIPSSNRMGLHRIGHGSGLLGGSKGRLASSRVGFYSAIKAHLFSARGNGDREVQSAIEEGGRRGGLHRIKMALRSKLCSALVCVWRWELGGNSNAFTVYGRWPKSLVSVYTA